VKRLLAATAGALVIALAAAGCGNGGGTGGGKTDSSGTQHLTVSLTDSIIPFYYPWGVAAAKGFWKDQGLDVDIAPGEEGSAAMMQQLVGGNADVAHPGPTVVFDAVKQGYGDDVTIFGTWLYKQGFQLKVPDGSSITDAEQLRGKTIGVSDMAGGEVPILTATLQAHGMEQGKDYHLLPIGGAEPQTVKAIKDGQVDAYCTSQKDFIALDVYGLKMKDITFPEWGSLTANVFVASRKVVEDNPDALEKYMRGLIEAVIYTHEHPEEALAAMKKEFPAGFADYDDKFSLNWIKLTEQRIYLPDLASQQALLTVDEKGLQGYLDFLHGVGQYKDTDIDLGDLVNTDITKKANDFDYSSVD
jgi:ABC-type nitrate/sulfonate/bicarbonate transport system substrate-binding protein